MFISIQHICLPHGLCDGTHHTFFLTKYSEAVLKRFLERAEL